MSSHDGARRPPAHVMPGNAALSLVHVLANRGHVRLARLLTRLLPHATRGLVAARAAVLRETLDLDHRVDAPQAPTSAESRWANALESLLENLDGQFGERGGSIPPTTHPIRGPQGTDQPSATGTPTPRTGGLPDTAGPRRDLIDATTEALVLAFHPRLHQGAETSPLVADPQGFGALLEPHAVTDLLRARTPREHGGTRRRDNTPAPAAHTPVRLLVLTDTNLTFMAGLLRHWEGREDIDLRVRDLRAENLDARWWSLKATVEDRLAGRPPTLSPNLVEDVRWSDVVWVEWGGALAARLSAADLHDTRLVVRLHRYEAFTMYPQVTHWEGVEDLVVVSGAVEGVLRATVPGIGERTRIRVIGNVVDLHRFVLPKRPSAARTLALIGWDRPVKDPDWALDVLDVLRPHDPSWRLLLVGRAPAGGDRGAEGAWAQTLASRVAAHGRSVVCLGQRDDIPEVLRDASVVLSSSLVESSHLAVQEGAASGCLPVVRNWPGIAALGGAAEIYPRDWVVATPEEAARRILEAARAPGVGEHGPADSAAAHAATRWALAHLDASRTLPLVDDLIEGERP